MEIVDLLEYSERAQLREWFERNAASQKCCRIAMYRGKKKPEGVCLPYIEVVEESLCFGWIDSTLKRLPDGRLAQRLSPRQKRSHWTELNKQRCADLEARGLMTDLGRTCWSFMCADTCSRSSIAMTITSSRSSASPNALTN